MIFLLYTVFSLFYFFFKVLLTMLLCFGFDFFFNGILTFEGYLMSMSCLGKTEVVLFNQYL